MSSLQKDPSGNFHVCFRFQRTRYKRSLKTKSEKRANSIVSKLDERVWLIKSGHLEVPENDDVGNYLIFGNQAKRQHQPTPTQKRPVQKLSMSQLFDQYFDTIGNGSLDAETIKMLQIHRRHLEKGLGNISDTEQLTPKHLQIYINKRAKCHGKFGRPLCGSTIKKELVTLRSIWLWAKELQLHDCDLSLKKLKLPKTFELLPFQTKTQIQSQIERGGLSEIDIRELWESLYLTKQEIGEVMTIIRSNASAEFVYPMVSVAAFAGVRKSELLRMQINDVQSNRILIRERKRVRGEYSTRFVPITGSARVANDQWIANHPGGMAMYCNQFGKAITKDGAHYHLKRTLADTEWNCIKGYHVFRHSFISALAIDGVDQRVIDEIVGHTTEQQRRRYRHLTPNVTLEAVDRVFG